MSQDYDFGFSVPQDQVADASLGLPDGEYPLKLVAHERCVSKNDNKNWYVKAKFEVLSGPAAGRVHFQNFNVGHTKENVKAFAMSDLKQLSKAVGYTGPISKMDPYVGQPFCATIKNTPQKDDADKMNTEIKKYKPISEYSSAPKIVGSFPAVAQVAPVIQSAPAANNDSVAVDVAKAESAIAAAPKTTAPWGAKAA